MIRSTVIKEFCQHIGIDDVKVTSAEPHAEAAMRFSEQLREGLFFNSRRLENNSAESFHTVQTRFPLARSIVSACLCYLTDEIPDRSTLECPHGLVARYTWRNHYKELRQRLKKLGQFLKEEYKATFCVYSNGPIAEKPIAERSGIGYFGKHSIVLHPEYGSWIVLGELITDLEIEHDNPLAMECGDCQRCIEACPTGALIRPYILDRKRCIQTLTNWYGIIPDDIATVWKNRLYGCTTCQDVCPKNQDVKPREPRTNIGCVGPSISLNDILEMDESTYRRQFADNQITASWINFTAIQRNALIALGNVEHTSNRHIIERFEASADPVLRHTARWARMKIEHE